MSKYNRKFMLGYPPEGNSNASVYHKVKRTQSLKEPPCKQCHNEVFCEEECSTFNNYVREVDDYELAHRGDKQ